MEFSTEHVNKSHFKHAIGTSREEASEGDARLFERETQHVSVTYTRVADSFSETSVRKKIVFKTGYFLDRAGPTLTYTEEPYIGNICA